MFRHLEGPRFNIEEIHVPSEPLICVTYIGTNTKKLSYTMTVNNEEEDSRVFNGVCEDYVPIETHLIKTNDRNKIFNLPIYNPIMDEIKNKVLNNFTEEFENIDDISAYIDIALNNNHKKHDLDNMYKVYGIVKVNNIVIKFLADYLLDSTKEKVFIEYDKFHDIQKMDTFYKGSEDQVTFHINIQQFNAISYNDVIYICNKLFKSYVIYNFSENNEFLNNDCNINVFTRIVACKNIRRMMVLNRYDKTENNINITTRYVIIDNALYVYNDNISGATMSFTNKAIKLFYETKDDSMVKEFDYYDRFNVKFVDINGEDEINYGLLTDSEFLNTISKLKKERKFGKLQYYNLYEFVLKDISTTDKLYYNVFLYIDPQLISPE